MPPENKKGKHVQTLLRLQMHSGPGDPSILLPGDEYVGSKMQGCSENQRFHHKAEAGSNAANTWALPDTGLNIRK